MQPVKTFVAPVGQFEYTYRVAQSNEREYHRVYDFEFSRDSLGMDFLNMSAIFLCLRKGDERFLSAHLMLNKSISIAAVTRPAFATDAGQEFCVLRFCTEPKNWQLPLVLCHTQTFTIRVVLNREPGQDFYLVLAGARGLCTTPSALQERVTMAGHGQPACLMYRTDNGQMDPDSCVCTPWAPMFTGPATLQSPARQPPPPQKRQRLRGPPPPPQAHSHHHPPSRAYPAVSSYATPPPAAVAPVVPPRSKADLAAYLNQLGKRNPTANGKPRSPTYGPNSPTSYGKCSPPSMSERPRSPTYGPNSPTSYDKYSPPLPSVIKYPDVNGKMTEVDISVEEYVPEPVK